jgi:hypothetical protein
MPPHARPVQAVPIRTKIGYTRLPGCVTQAERVLDYLWSIAPNGATNGELARSLGIRSHQTVYMLTQLLLHQGRIRGSLSGTIWVFHVAEEPSTTLGTGPAWTNDTTLAVRFEALARRVLSDHYAVDLTSGSLPGVAKLFDFVSPDRRVVGDAKYFSLVGGVGLPAAKFSIIAEHVWLLEKTSTPTTFLVFGNDRAVPQRWLARYGVLAPSVAFSLCITMERSSV